MTKTELQSALAEATQTDKRTAGVFLDTLSALAYKEIKKNGEFVLPGFGPSSRTKRGCCPEDIRSGNRIAQGDPTRGRNRQNFL